MDISSIRCLADNVLVQLSIHTDHHTDRLSPGGIVLPRMRNIESEDAILATVIAVGSGYYADKFIDHEQGTSPVGSTKFIPVDPAIVPGAVVVLERAALAADRIYSDERNEYRMVRAATIAAVVEE